MDALIMTGSIVSTIFEAVLFYVIVLTIVSVWHTYKKAGKPGWASIVPIYNLVVLLEIAEKPKWWVILMFIPLVNIVIFIIVNESIGRKFGKPNVFGALGLTFLPFIFYPILASSKTEYLDEGIKGKKHSRIDRLGILLSSFIINYFVFFPLYVIKVLLYGLTGNLDLSSPITVFGVFYIFYVLLFICVIGIWKYQKWGVYLFVILYILMFIRYLIIGLDITYSLTLFLKPIFLILLIIPVWNVFNQK